MSAIIAPRRAVLAAVPAAERRRILARQLPRLLGPAWEALCRATVPLLPASSLGLPAGDAFGPAARYWAPGVPEWDVAAASIDGRTLLVGEVKWQDGEASEAVVRRAVAALLAKGEPPFAAGRRVVRAVFLPSVPRALLGRTSPVALVDGASVLAASRRVVPVVPHAEDEVSSC